MSGGPASLNLSAEFNLLHKYYMLLRVKSTRRIVCCESLPLSFRASFDLFDIKSLLHFSVSSTLSALSLQGGFVFWEMLSSGAHRFSQFP